MFGEYFNVRKSISLEAAGDEFKVDAPKYLHKSDDDSQLTMGLVKNMANSLDCSLEELIELCESCSGSSINFDIKYDDYEVKLQKRYDRAKADTTNILRKGNYKMFMQFLDGVKPQGEIIQSSLTGKSLCISINYELYHFREMLAIVQLLVNHGATYKLKASQNDMFISYPEKDENGNERFCTRLKYVNEAISEGKKIEIITFDELLSVLKTNESQLKEFPFPEKDSFVKKPKQRNREKRKVEHIESSGGTTLGELLKAQGINMEKLKEFEYNKLWYDTSMDIEMAIATIRKIQNIVIVLRTKM